MTRALRDSIGLPSLRSLRPFSMHDSSRSLTGFDCRKNGSISSTTERGTRDAGKFDFDDMSESDMEEDAEDSSDAPNMLQLPHLDWNPSI